MAARMWFRAGLLGAIVILVGYHLAADPVASAAAGGLLHPWRRGIDRPRPAGCVDVTFDGAGVALRGWRCQSSGERRGALVLLHGVADNARRSLPTSSGSSGRPQGVAVGAGSRTQPIAQHRASLAANRALDRRCNCRGRKGSRSTRFPQGIPGHPGRRPVEPRAEDSRAAERELAPGPFEQHRTRSEPVDVRALHGRMAVTAERSVHVIGGPDQERGTDPFRISPTKTPQTMRIQREA